MKIYPHHEEDARDFHSNLNLAILRLLSDLLTSEPDFFFLFFKSNENEEFLSWKINRLTKLCEGIELKLLEVFFCKLSVFRFRWVSRSTSVFVNSKHTFGAEISTERTNFLSEFRICLELWSFTSPSNDVWSVCDSLRWKLWCLITLQMWGWQCFLTADLIYFKILHFFFCWNRL